MLPSVTIKLNPKLFAFILTLIYFVGYVSIDYTATEAAAFGTIDGKVLNRTLAGDKVADIPVTLYIQKAASGLESGFTIVNETRSDANGIFQFKDVDTNPSNIYLVATQYKGATYSGNISFKQGETNVGIDLSVYETTEENVGLKISNASLIIAGFDEVDNKVIAMEVVSLLNPSEKTYIPNPRGPQGPMGLPRFSLPPGATDLTVHEGIDQAQVIQVDRGFGVMSPILPGPTEIIYAYRFPYEGSSVSVSKSLSMGADEYLVLVQKGPWSVSSPQLTAQGAVNIGGKEYYQLGGQNLGSGSNLVIDITGIPAPGPLEKTVSSVPMIAWLGIAVMAGVAAALYLFSLRGRRSMKLATAQALDAAAAGGGDTLSQSILMDIVELDERYSKGEISTEEYRKRREILKENAKAVIRSDGEQTPQ